MAIKSNLSTLMGKNRLNIQDVFEATGISRRTISALYHDKVTRVDYGTLNKLCELFECNTQELLEYVPDKRADEER